MASSNDTAVRNTYNRWINQRKHLAVLYAKPAAERKESVDSIERIADLLEKKLTRLSSTFAKQQQRVEWKDIQNKLHAGEAAIEFASFQLTTGNRYTDTVSYVALVLRKGNPLPSLIPLFNEKDLTDLLASVSGERDSTRVRKLYTSAVRDNDSNLTTNGSLYELIWKPLEKELTGITTVYFAPAGLLHRIAFAALPVSGKEVLSDRFKLVQLATTASVADQQQSFVTAADKIQLYGGINYSADTTVLKNTVASFHTKETLSRSLPDDLIRSGAFRDLPGTKREIDGIVTLATTNKRHVTTRSSIAASEESLKALDGKASPAVLHIATHGYFYPEPKRETGEQGSLERGGAFKFSADPLMRSGLLFAGANSAWQYKPVAGIDDDILTAYEVANLYLPNTKLAVLSACETGLGDIQGSEGVYGLQRAFKMAGVENLVMSLWKVPDGATAAFMLAFYKNLFVGKSIGEAFYGAQTTMKTKYRNAPYKWAAWVLLK